MGLQSQLIDLGSALIPGLWMGKTAKDLGSGSQIPDEDRKYEMSFWWYYLDLIKIVVTMTTKRV